MPARPRRSLSVAMGALWGQAGACPSGPPKGTLQAGATTFAVNADALRL